MTMRNACFLLAFILLALLSCEKGESPENPTLVGSWRDTYEPWVTFIQNGDTTRVQYTNITFHIYDNGKYEVENPGITDLNWERGSWTYNDSTRLVHFTQAPENVFGGIQEFLQWEVLLLSNTTLEVNPTLDVIFPDSLPLPIRRAWYRKFNKL